MIGVLGTLILGFLFGIFLDWFSRSKKIEKVAIEEIPVNATEEVADDVAENATEN